MIKIDKLSLQRGGVFLLEEADLTLFPGQKVAIVGANGAGKSSLFSLILGHLANDAGSIDLPSSWRISHMAQEVSETHRTAVDYVLDGDQKLRAIQARLAKAEENHDMDAIAKLHAELDTIDGYQASNRAEKLLHGLGFQQADLSRPVSTFSGGWRIRLNLAQALMSPADLLLLDEPTNHLDLDATLWLEKWLIEFTGTLLFISHDRDFIDNVANHIVHFEHKKLRLYSGSYSAFERQRAERLAQQQVAFEKQQQRIAEIGDFVRRFRAKASKAKQAQSRLKELERMEQIAPAHVDSPFNFEFPESENLSSPLLVLKNAVLGYPERSILEQVKLSILPGSRFGLLGHNGAGKSTLIKSLTGQLSLCAGERHEGKHLSVGYFAQHQLEALDMNASPILHVQRLSPDAREQDIRNFLGGFGFQGDDALSEVKRFSGGQKARLALALIAWRKPNLLLLDEPTNHLDLEMRHALTMALQVFSGAVIIVSHDRHLLKNTVDQFLLVDQGRVSEFDGSLAEYEQWLLQPRKAATTDTDSLPASNNKQSAEEKKNQKRLEAERRQRLSPLKKQLAKLETKMSSLQVDLKQLEETLSAPEIYEEAHKNMLKDTLEKQSNTQKELDDIETQWFELSEELEHLEAN